MSGKIVIASVLSLFAVGAFAQDSTKSGPVITGSVDAYTRYNFNDPKPVEGATISNVNNYTSFSNSHKSYELGMASLRVDHSLGKASATIDVGFGKRAEEFAYANTENSTLLAIKQAYVSYAVSDNVKFTMGKWATHIGYELVDAYLNRNYSMSYMFSYGPFSHTGVKADIGLGGKSAIMLGVANTTDFVTTTSARKYGLAQFSTGSANDKFKAYFNYQGSYGGSSNLTQFDVVLTQSITDKFSLGYNGTIQSVKPKSGSGNSWWGSALYVNVDPTDAFGITLRGEYFDNKKGVSAAPQAGIFNLTLSPNIKLGNLVIIPELRLESSNNAIYTKANGAGIKSTTSFILGAAYHF